MIGSDEHEVLAQLGQQHYRESPNSLLGEPLDIAEVAELLGCSPWTVRQKYLRQGLPHIRTCVGGRFVFFREQVIAWILKRQQIQQKGGYRK
jgi:excisionase family DNA binding protein